MAKETESSEDLLKSFEEESEAFFDSLLNEAAGGSSAASPAPSVPNASVASAPSKQDPAKASPPTATEAAAAAAAAATKGSASASTAALAAADKVFSPPERSGAGGTSVSSSNSAKVASPVTSPAATSGAPARPKAESDAELFEQLSQQVRQGDAAQTTAGVGATSSSAAAGSSSPGANKAPGSSVAMFSLDSGDSDSDCAGLEQSGEDLLTPEIPEPPENFTSEDRALREALVGFYMRYKADNLANVNLIVEKYRGSNVSHLWVQLALKYNLPAIETIGVLARTLYVTSTPFEYEDQDVSERLGSRLDELKSRLANERRERQLKAAGGGAGLVAPASHAELIQRAVESGAADGTDDMLRLLCFRGMPEDAGLRPMVWKVLLGYLPMDRHSEWNAIHGEKRALYLGYKQELLTVSGEQDVAVREAEGRAAGGADLQECRDLLQEIKNDVDRTRRDFEFFRRPSSRSALIALLFVYARLNPGVRYVQGMNEVAAVLFYVMSADLEAAEADTFWCFSEMMAEIKDNFMQAMDDTNEGVHAIVAGVTRLLRVYDPDLARHLQQSELPPFVWAFRWCTLLFAQDATLPDVVRLWDSFIGDPRRFEFVVHVALAAVISSREEILSNDKQFALAEVLQGAPRAADFDTLLRKSFAICALERRPQTPPFPPKSLQVVEDLSELAQSAAEKAKEVSAEVSKRLQEHITPAMQERAGETAKVVASAAQDGAQAVQTWLQDTAPARQEALTKAQTAAMSFWDSVRTNSATAVSKTQRLASDYAPPSENPEGAKTRFSMALPGLTAAAGNAASTASAVSMRASTAWAAGVAAWAAAAESQAAAQPNPARDSSGSGGSGGSSGGVSGGSSSGGGSGAASAGGGST